MFSKQLVESFRNEKKQKKNMEERGLTGIIVQRFQEEEEEQQQEEQDVVETNPFQ